jgi:hypothetical protein
MDVSYSFMLGDTKVSFYAIDPGESARLKANLEAIMPGYQKTLK